MIRTFVLSFAIALSSVSSFSADIHVVDSDGKEVVVSDVSRIAAVGGDITEILYALGASDSLVARDDTSYFPPEVEQLPSMGYMRTLAPEGVLSVNPSVVIAAQGSGPEATIKQLRDAGVPLVMVERGNDFDAVKRKITLIAKAINKEGAGKSLIQTLEKQYTALKKAVSSFDDKPKVLFLMNAQRGTLMAAGGQTGAEAMINIAGGQNAVSGFHGYKAISAESAVKAQPDVIVIPSHGAERVGGVEGVASMPELKDAPAVKNKKVVQFDSLYLLMFGPRFVYAASELAETLHDDYKAPNELQVSKSK